MPKKKLKSHYLDYQCQLPTSKIVEEWAQQVPKSFRFVLKGSQSITHFKRLRNAEKATDDFLAVASVLKKRLGPILLQLPPNFKKDVSRLDVFLSHVAGRAKVAFEFRNATWFDDEVFDCLRSHSAVLCVSDRDGLPKTGLVRTAKWGYVRLWNDKYTAKRLRQMSLDINAQKWTEAYVIFMHEDDGVSPKLATRFMKQCERKAAFLADCVFFSHDRKILLSLVDLRVCRSTTR